MMTLTDFSNRILPIRDKLYRFALRITGNVPEAEDVVQEVFIKAWNNSENLIHIQNPEAWCMTMTKNLSIDKMRSKHRKMQGLDGIPEMQAPSGNPLQQTELNDTLSRVHKIISSLPEKQQMIIQLRDIEGLPYDEIAQILSIPLEQVKVYLHRARTTIKQQLLNAELYGLR